MSEHKPLLKGMSLSHVFVPSTVPELWSLGFRAVEYNGVRQEVPTAAFQLAMEWDTGTEEEPR